ncbi:MAG: hypothetical protein ACE5KE_15510, partial [Methanosarcinales archaeon]
QAFDLIDSEAKRSVDLACDLNPNFVGVPVGERNATRDSVEECIEVSINYCEPIILGRSETA